MLNRSAFFLALLLAINLACSSLSLPSLPTPAPTSMLDPNLRHFEDQWVAFDYPAGLDVYEGMDPDFIWTPNIDHAGEQVAALGDPQAMRNGVYLRSIRILHRGLPAGADVRQTMLDTYGAFKDRYHTRSPQLQMSPNILVGGVRAYQETYSVFWGEPAYDLRDVWLSHGDTLYLILVVNRWTARPEFYAVSDIVLRSLDIK